jgi:Kef-type K+ transport system membrane component KefB
MDFFTEISQIVVLAALICGVSRYFKQPIFVGYIITGVLAGPYFLSFLTSPELIKGFSSFGIALLLFIVGMNLNPLVIKEVGKTSAIAGFSQVLVTTLVGAFIARFLGYTFSESLYIGIGLTFSSTIVIIKLLSDKGDLEKIQSKISIGILIFQDLIAFLILMGVSIFEGSNSTVVTLLNNIPFLNTSWGFAAKFLTLMAFMYLAAKYFVPKIALFFAKSQEFLFLFSLAWGMGIASLFHMAGFSMEIGALAAGIALSTTPYNIEIASKMKPLRDFFLILFFISAGSQIQGGAFNFWHVGIFSLFVLILNPVILTSVLFLMGYTKRVAFYAGLTMSQISEFSIIVVGLGVKSGSVGESVLSMITSIGMLTIMISSYLIIYADSIYHLLRKFLSRFERNNVKKVVTSIANYDVVLFGYSRVGYDFCRIMNDLNFKSLIVDFDPETITKLRAKNYECRYGDAEDVDFLEELNFESVKMVVSTIPDYMTNALLIEHVRKINQSSIIMVVSHHLAEIKDLYKLGADYVIMPHFLGGKYASELLVKYGFDKEQFTHERESHLKSLEERNQMGRKHQYL